MNEAIINDIIEVEGDFTDDPTDHGGATRWGVTQATLEAWRGSPVSVEDVRTLSITEARLILEDLYIKKPGFDRIASEVLRDCLVDYGVNSGPSAAIKALQRCLGVKADGVIGSETERAANIKPGTWLSVKVTAQRIRHLGRIVTNDHTQARFAAGWANRIASKLEGLSI